jgi:hypothetical protein
MSDQKVGIIANRPFERNKIKLINKKLFSSAKRPDAHLKNKSLLVPIRQLYFSLVQMIDDTLLSLQYLLVAA